MSVAGSKAEEPYGDSGLESSSQPNICEQIVTVKDRVEINNKLRLVKDQNFEEVHFKKIFSDSVNHWDYPVVITIRKESGIWKTSMHHEERTDKIIPVADEPNESNLRKALQQVFDLPSTK